MLSIGWRNLRKDKARTAIAVLGVVFAVVLVTVEVGMLLGMLHNSSVLIDHSRADLWISSTGVKTFDFAQPFALRKKDRVMAIPGVEAVEQFDVSFSAAKLSDGSEANVQVIALDERGSLAAELPLVAGSLEDLHNQDTIIVDEADLTKLGVKLGDSLEVIGHRARICGITRGMRAFTTNPFIFTSVRNGRQYGFRNTAETAFFLLVKTAAGADPAEVKAQINASITGIEARTRSEISWLTRSYWLIQTGIGLAFLGAAFLGLLVGGAIVSQTLYAMTLEKLPEYGLLKALGASMPEICRSVLQQSFVCGAAGLAAGLTISVLIAVAATRAGTAIEITPLLLLLSTGMTALLCSGASLLSIRRLWALEPASVFRT
jgi:putative ABC transport system permease protein